MGKRSDHRFITEYFENMFSFYTLMKKMLRTAQFSVVQVPTYYTYSKCTGVFLVLYCLSKAKHFSKKSRNLPFNKQRCALSKFNHETPYSIHHNRPLADDLTEASAVQLADIQTQS